MELTFLTEEDVAVHSQATLADYTTFRLGGICPSLINCQTPEQLQRIAQRLIEEKVDFILIGGGSNLLVSDRGINKVVVRYVSEVPLVERQGNDLIVAGSTLLDDLALFAAQHELEGLSCTTGIPGTVGGAIVGNAGAFGKQIGDYLKSVVLMNRQGRIGEADPATLGFRYRHSGLKETGEIVIACRIGLKGGNREALLKERQEILDLRHSKHPDLKAQPSAGSFFRNVEPTSAAGQRQAAGWFLDQAGAKGLRVGGAVTYEKHANIIIKTEGCLSQHVLELSKLMFALVKEKFGIELIREVRLVGKFEGVDSKEDIW